MGVCRKKSLYVAEFDCLGEGGEGVAFGDELVGDVAFVAGLDDGFHYVGIVDFLSFVDLTTLISDLAVDIPVKQITSVQAFVHCIFRIAMLTILNHRLQFMTQLDKKLTWKILIETKVKVVLNFLTISSSSSSRIN